MDFDNSDTRVTDGRAALSVVIPTLEAADALPVCLAALLPGVEAGLVREVIVADGGSADATCAIAEAAGARIVETARGRGRQLSAGARTARGEWFLFLHADTVLDSGWAAAAAAFIAHCDGCDCAATFRLRFDDASFAARFVETAGRLRGAFLRLPYGDQGLLISRAFYERIGGYTDDPLFEDISIVRRIVRAVGRSRFRILPVDAVTSAARYREHGWARRVVGNAWLLARYFTGASPSDLARRYDP